MRIIGGEARGRTLVAPPGQATRPTQDYVRESLFNILAPRVEGARILDLFAGTGALALEALSRGAAEAVLCDRDRAALSAIQKNVEAVRCADRVRVFAGDYAACLRACPGPYDLIFLDPPYARDAAPVLAQIVTGGLLASGGRIVVEHRRGAQPEILPPLVLADQRRYGDTEISFLKRGD